MNDFFSALKIEELLQKKLKQLKNNEKRKKVNIFTTLQKNNKSNFINSNDFETTVEIKTTKKYIKLNDTKSSSFIINTNNQNRNSNLTTNNSITNSGSSHFSSSKNRNTRNALKNKKGGVVVNKQSIIVKTNFEMAGRLNKSGKRPTSKEVGSHASASLSYIDNHGNKDLDCNEELSNTYNEVGSRITKDEFKGLQSDLKNDIQSFRRIIIDTGQKDFNRDDLNKLVVGVMQNFKEQTGKNFEFKFAVHTDTEHIHTHIICYGKNSDINFTKEHLQSFKVLVGDKTNEILLDKQLEKERNLTLNEQIDKEISYKFGNTYITENEEINSSKSLTL